MLELVEVKKEGLAAARLLFLPADGELVNLRHKQCAEQVRVLLSNQSLRKWTEKNFPLVHDASEIEPVFALGHDVADGLRSQKAVESREQRRDGVRGLEQRKLVLPIVEH